MATGSLLALLDDIATLLDDIALLSKVAAKKTTGVLGDDLALNAEQVSGVKADRELPVVWAVAKGSLLNKLILVPTALLISAVVPSLITVLLVIGGLYLCYEGFEKISHAFIKDKAADEVEHQRKLAAMADPAVNVLELEKDKIKGAIRTDFILSAEIIVIVLGTVQEATFATQVAVVSTLALLITLGVYGVVAAIVKIDDLGLYLLRQSVSGSFNALQRALGRSLLIFAPMLMKTLSVVGTAAMFLVGGGIFVHSIGFFHHQAELMQQWLNESAFSNFGMLISLMVEGFLGLVAGALVLLLVTPVLKIFKPKQAH